MGFKYINLRRHFFSNSIYPNAWFSILYYINRRLKILQRNFKMKIHDVNITPLKIISDERGKGCICFVQTTKF